MNKNRILIKLEDSLSHFLISEACKNDPSKRGSSEMYKYKGLSISTNENVKNANKLLAIRIGALEAQFKIENGDKVSGNLAPDDEGKIQIWMAQSDNKAQMRTIFLAEEMDQIEIPIIPFDLEDFYSDY